MILHLGLIQGTGFLHDTPTSHLEHLPVNLDALLFENSPSIFCDSLKPACSKGENGGPRS